MSQANFFIWFINTCLHLLVYPRQIKLVRISWTNITKVVSNSIGPFKLYWAKYREHDYYTPFALKFHRGESNVSIWVDGITTILIVDCHSCFSGFETTINLIQLIFQIKSCNINMNPKQIGFLLVVVNCWKVRVYSDWINIHCSMLLSKDKPIYWNSRASWITWESCDAIRNSQYDKVSCLQRSMW